MLNRMDLLLVVAAICALVVSLSAEFGPSGYTEYLPGSSSSRIVLSAPHGGSVKPSDIPNRDAGCWSDFNAGCTWSHTCGEKDKSRCKASVYQDYYTLNLSTLIRRELQNLTGVTPHLVISHLHRSKLDPNREVKEAAFDVISATTAWWEYHNFLLQAKETVGRSGPGLLLDIHGQSHPEKWIELGYIIRGNNLDSGNFTSDMSSIRNLAATLQNRVEFDDLLRGPSSFGAMLETRGYKVVPSPKHPGPDGGKYYNGGYITRAYGSQEGGQMDAIQIESPRVLRGEDVSPAYAKDLAEVIVEFMRMHYNDFNPGAGDVTGEFDSTTQPISGGSKNTTQSTSGGLSREPQGYTHALVLVFGALLWISIAGH